MRRAFLQRCLCAVGAGFGGLLARDAAATGGVPDASTAPTLSTAGLSGTADGVAVSPPEMASVSAARRMPLSRVRLLDGPLLAAQRTDLRYLMALDADRLLAPFRREAGLPQPKPSYGNWESSGLDGHMGGHYVSALAMMAASTGDESVTARLRQVLRALRACQLAQGDGYLGGIPDGRAAWREIARGELKVDSFSVNGRWVPWYNLHKTFAGLRDAWVICEEPLARTMLVDLGGWSLRLLEPLSDAQLQDMMRAEHGGMNELFVDLAEITGEARYRAMARRFSHRAILDPLLQQQDALTGLHANTQIPKVIGFARIAELPDRDAPSSGCGVLPPRPLAGEGGDERQGTRADHWLEAARFFWQTVHAHRSVAIGGNSVKEHFHALDDFQPMLDEVEGPETCNTYNMLKLTELLHAHAPDDASRARYAGFHERALFNHVLASQHPSGGFVYFTPMRPQHYRVYSQVDLGMWCCVGSGLESHARHGQFIYSQADGAIPTLYVNLFAASSLDWREQGVTLRQITRFPDEAATRLVIDAVTGDQATPSRRFALKIRHPGWVKPGALRVTLNGRRVALSAEDARPGGYVTLERDWRAGDVVALRLPMQTRLESMPTRPDHVAVLHGPIVLAARTRPLPQERLEFRAGDARMDHIAQGERVPLAQAPLFVSADADFSARLIPIPGRPLSLRTGSLLQGPDGAPMRDLVLEPFFRLHDSRYMLYWPVSTPQQARERRERLARDEQARIALQARTVDAVAPGEQQPESDHGFEGDGVDTGLNGGRRWRHATRWFSYRLNDSRREGRVLRLVCSPSDDGRRFAVWLNDRLLTDLTLRAPAGLPSPAERERGGGEGSRQGTVSTLYDLDLPIPEDWPRSADGSMKVRFIAAPGSIAGGLYDLRLLRS